jgi:hypothetical protein
VKFDRTTPHPSGVVSLQKNWLFGRNAYIRDMAWTTEQLAALEDAIAQGALRVRYADKEVEYRSLAEMMQLRDNMQTALSLRPRRKVWQGYIPGC